MGLFFPDDPSYDLSVRQTGFLRYRQLLSLHFGEWLKVNLLTVAGALPLAAGIGISVLTSSVVVLIPASLAGGMVFGPFLACLYDGILRRLRDNPDHWWANYRKSWRQNWKGSLLPGAILGLFLGMYCFMGMLFWWAQTGPSPGTLALYLFSGLVFLLICTLYWPQLVLFRQRTADRLRNLFLFTAKYFWRVMGASLLQLAYWALFVLLAPITLLLIPMLGFWFILFVGQFLIYEPLNRELHIEELYREGRCAPSPGEPEEEPEAFSGEHP